MNVWRQLALHLKSNCARCLLFALALTLAVAGAYLCLGLQQKATDYNLLKQKQYTASINEIADKAKNYVKKHLNELDFEQAKAIEDNAAKQIKSLLRMIDMRGEGDWKGELRESLVQMQAAKEMAGMMREAAPADLEWNMAFNRYLLTHEIKPKTPADVCDGLNNLQMFSENLLFMALAICPLLYALLDVPTSRRGGGNRFLLQQPVCRQKIVAAKFAAVVLQSLATIVVLCAGLFLTGALLFGPGDPRYPVGVGTNMRGVAFIPVSLYFLQTLPLALCTILLFSAMGILLSACVQNESTCGVLCILIPAASLFVQELIGQQTPFSFLLGYNSSPVLTAQSLPAWWACVGQLAAAGAYFALGSWAYRRKDQA